MEPRLPRFLACELRPTSKRMFGLALACAAIGAAFSCESDKKPERKPAKTTARNVVLILIDTLRADKLGCYGNTLGLTPNIDQIASEGFRFDQAFSHAPWTLPATASLLTSSYPQQHGAGQKRKGGTSNFDFTGLAPDVRTVAECYYDEGFHTHAIVNVLFLAPKKFGIDRGFSTFDFKAQDSTQSGDRRATEVTDLAINWMKEHRQNSDRPFFLLVHYFDPHLKYDPPAEFRKKYALPQDYQPDPTLFGSESDMINFRNGVLAASQIPLKRLEALYNGEVAYTDEQVGRLWEEIKKMGIGDQTVIALTADHGEEFFDHNGFEHGHTLYDEMIRVPLILWGPGAVKPGMSKTAIGHVDVAPTLCALSDVVPYDTFQGTNLQLMMDEHAIADHRIFSQGNMWGPELQALRLDGYKIIEKKIGREAYEVRVDPKERRNLARESEFIKLCDELQKKLVEFSIRLGTKPGIPVALTAQEQKGMDGMGYTNKGRSESELSSTQPATQPTTQDSKSAP